MAKPLAKTEETIRKIGRPIEWTAELIEEERLALDAWIADKKNYFFTSFLNERRLGMEQVERFARTSQSFCESLALARRTQEQRLVELAVTRKGDPNFIKFVLQNKAGWKERNEVSGDQSNPLAVLLDRIGTKAKDPIEVEYAADELE